MEKSRKTCRRKLNQYPLLHHIIASIIFKSIHGLCSNRPVLLEIDGYLILNFQRYGKMPMDWWQKHLSLYSINYASLAQTSAWIKFEHSFGMDVFQEGTYFYNCKSGCFEIEIDSNGMLVDILGEFNGNTPSIILDLFKDYPEQEYLSKDGLENQLSKKVIIDDMVFVNGLEPSPFQIIEID